MSKFTTSLTAIALAVAALSGAAQAEYPEKPVAEHTPEQDVAFWNGLFVHKDTPQEVREKIIAVASNTVMSDRAQKLAAETGAQ